MKLAKRWEIRRPEPEVVLKLSSALSVSEPVARLLAARGFDSPEAAIAFLEADLEALENPYLLPDMEKAVRRLMIAVKRREKVFVAGDRDTDGVTSTALLVNLLELLGLDVGWKVPSPKDGYGLSSAAVAAAVEAKASLLVTVDCGIRDIAGVEEARGKGMDVIVLDHHEPGEELPRAWAVVDAKRADSAYPFPDLSACGVAFKFAQAALLATDPEFHDRTIVFFDVETTGMSPARDEIIEIAGLKTRNGVEIGRFESLIKPEGAVPAALTEIHGITEAMLAGAPPASEVVPAFIEFAGDAVLAAHNVTFDLNFLAAAAEKHGGRKVRNETFDTLAEARGQFPATDHRLGALTEKLGIVHDEKHRALSDVFAVFALFRRLISRRNDKLQYFLKNSLDLVALSTLADVVPLRGENRVLVKRGLEALKKSARPGVEAMREAFLRNESITAKDVAWSLVPALNAAGRMGRASRAVELLLAKGAEEARLIVAELSALNAERKERLRTNSAAVMEELDRSFDPGRDSVAVVAVKEIEHGVTGIVANRVVGDLGRPTLIFIDDGSERMVGTARSIPGYDIVAALERLAHLLEKYGGHAGAAGVTVLRENLERLKRELDAMVAAEVPADRLIPRLGIDAEVRVAEVSARLLAELERLEPTGHGNERAVFCVRNATVAEAKRMGDRGQHLKLALRGDGARMEAVLWNADLAWTPMAEDRVDLAFTMEKNDWNGRAGVQCLIEDVRRTESRA